MNRIARILIPALLAFAASPAGAATPLSDIAEISVGYLHACARTSAGAVWCWGWEDWIHAPNKTQIEASGFAPSDPLESVILMTLDPGAYTAILLGADGGTGTGIIEVFALPD